MSTNRTKKKAEETKEVSVTKESTRGKSKRNTLTPRQTEVLKLLVEGMTNNEISEVVKTSVKTVDAHRAAIMMRLQIHDLPGLVKYAIQNSLTSID